MSEPPRGLGAATKEVRAALMALKAESEAAKAAAAAPSAADEDGAPSNAALSLACIGCLRLPSKDEREKHPICDMCRDEKLVPLRRGLPSEPWRLAAARSVSQVAQEKNRKLSEDGGPM